MLLPALLSAAIIYSGGRFQRFLQDLVWRRELESD